MKEQLIKLIEEGNALKSTFTEENYGMKYTSDKQNVSKWITKSMRVVEKAERLKEKSPIYLKLAQGLDNIGNLYIDGFEELIGLIEGINETYNESKIDFAHTSR